MYEDYKFVTKEDLARLGIANLLGTNLLRAYMHGFFIDHRLYNKVSTKGGAQTPACGKQALQAGQ